jgi:hypothetical protein
MSGDGPDNLVLRHLRQLAQGQAEMREGLREMKLRRTALAQQGANRTATRASHSAALSMRLDRVDARLDRIERPLDLVEAPGR